MILVIKVPPGVVVKTYDRMIPSLLTIGNTSKVWEGKQEPTKIGRKNP